MAEPTVKNGHKPAAEDTRVLDQIAEETAVLPPIVIPKDVDLDESRLRADLLTPTVVAVPGEPVTVTVQVLNTSTVIENIEVRLLALMAESVVVTPEELTLFPEESAEVTLELRFHRTLPAGEHEGIVVVSGASGELEPAELTLAVQVPEAAGATLVAEPPLRVAGKKGAFELRVANTGNTPLDLLIKAADADRKLGLYLSDPSLRLRVDETAEVALVARGRRPLTGAPVEHVITVDVAGGEIAEIAELRFRQKARFTPGIITMLTLMLIVGLWAVAMMFGVRAALAPPPPTKALPESFAAGVGLADLDPAAVGGTVSGTITAASTAQPLARVTIEAFDPGGKLVGATATGDDGTYELGGLLPSRYRLRFRAAGFEEQWWPAAPTAGDATPLMVPPTAVAEGTDAQLVGLTGALGGQALAGDGEPSEITVEVLALDLLTPVPAVTAVADAEGVWSVTGLPAPANYRITYRAEGYAPVEVTQPLEGGAQLVVNTTRLPAALGGITGIVLDRDGLPVGGVEVVAQRGDFALAVTTPTSGEVGTFTLPELETPGTYLLTLSAEGYAPETRAVRLGPGESLTDLEVVVTPATGVVFGRAMTSDGQPLGGVRVTVSGGGTVLTTDTFTSGAVGSFRLSGLPLPGIYAVTFDLDGYRRQTVQVELQRDVPQAFAEARLSASVGRITGRVVDATSGEPLGAVAIEVADGLSVRTTTSASAPASQLGRFNVGDLSPGTYTVTARVEGGGTVTVLHTVTAASTVDIVLRVEGAP